MARVTGNIENEDQNYSRRGSAARPGQVQTVMPQQGGNRMQQLLQAVGLQGMFGGVGQGPVITGDFSPEDLQRPGVTTDAGRGAPGRTDVTSSGQGRNANVRSVTRGRGGVSPLPPVNARNVLFPRGSLLAGATLAPTATMALGSLMEGRPLEAGVGTVGSVALGGATSALTSGLRKSPNIFAKGIGYAAPALMSALGYGAGSVAESQKAKATGQAISGKEGSLSEQEGTIRRLAELEMELGQAGMNQFIAASKDLRQNDIDMMVQAQQRLMPIAEQFQRNQLTRQQAMVNTMGQNYAMLGTLATAGKLATGAQAETGATVRTAMTANPYAGSTLQAPSISFG
jgi:hypothetical protein